MHSLRSSLSDEMIGDLTRLGLGPDSEVPKAYAWHHEQLEARHGCSHHALSRRRTAQDRGDRRPSHLAVSGRRRHVGHADLDVVRCRRRRTLRARLQQAAVPLVSSGDSSEDRSHSCRRHDEGRRRRRPCQHVETRRIADQVNAIGRMDAVIHNAGAYATSGPSV